MTRLWNFAKGEDKYKRPRDQTESQRHTCTNSNAHWESIPRKWQQANDSQYKTKESKENTQRMASW